MDLASLFFWISFFSLFSLVLSHSFGKDSDGGHGGEGRIDTVMMVMVDEGTTMRRGRKDNDWLRVWENIGCHG